MPPGELQAGHLQHYLLACLFACLPACLFALPACSSAPLRPVPTLPSANCACQIPTQGFGYSEKAIAQLLSGRPVAFSNKLIAFNPCNSPSHPTQGFGYSEKAITNYSSGGLWADQLGDFIREVVQRRGAAGGSGGGDGGAAGSGGSDAAAAEPVVLAGNSLVGCGGLCLDWHTCYRKSRYNRPQPLTFSGCHS